MVRVVWSPRSLRQLEAAANYIDQFSPIAAARMAARILAAGESLAGMPERGRPISGGRRELIAAPPYVLTYRLRGEEVEIVTVIHRARLRP